MEATRSRAVWWCAALALLLVSGWFLLRDHPVFHYHSSAAIDESLESPDSGEAAATAAQETPGGYYYTCPMHPAVRSSKPGRCPFCHMELEKVELKDRR